MAEYPDGNDDPSNDSSSEPSKSQAKREALALRDLGSALAELGDAERLRIPLDDTVRAAVDELNRIRANGAKKRQLGFLAKQLRRVDTAPIEEALEELRQTSRAQAHDHHRVESWRDRLLGDGPGETPADALTAFLDEHRGVDRQTLRQLQQGALAERKASRTPAAARRLFRLLRDTIATERETSSHGAPSEPDSNPDS